MSTPTTAADHLSAAQAYEVALRAEYAVSEPNRQVIAELHSKIGRGIKFAEVKALIRIGDALERLVETAPGQYLIETQQPVIVQVGREPLTADLAGKIRHAVNDVLKDDRR